MATRLAPSYNHLHQSAKMEVVGRAMGYPSAGAMSAYSEQQQPLQGGGSSNLQDVSGSSIGYVVGSHMSNSAIGDDQSSSTHPHQPPRRALQQPQQHQSTQQQQHHHHDYHLHMQARQQQTAALHSSLGYQQQQQQQQQQQLQQQKQHSHPQYHYATTTTPLTTAGTPHSSTHSDHLSMHHTDHDATTAAAQLQSTVRAQQHQTSTMHHQHQQQQTDNLQHHHHHHNTVPEESTSAEDVAAAFAYQYFKLMKIRPDDLSRFYDAGSRVSRGCNGQCAHRATGPKEITQLLREQHATGTPLLVANIKTIEGQDCVGGSVIIQITGVLHYIDDSSREFAMSAFLARQEPTSYHDVSPGYYVLNDIITFQDPVASSRPPHIHGSYNTAMHTGSASMSESCQTTPLRHPYAPAAATRDSSQLAYMNYPVAPPAAPSATPAAAPLPTTTAPQLAAVPQGGERFITDYVPQQLASPVSPAPHETPRSPAELAAMSAQHVSPTKAQSRPPQVYHLDMPSTSGSEQQLIALEEPDIATGVDPKDDIPLHEERHYEHSYRVEDVHDVEGDMDGDSDAFQEIHGEGQQQQMDTVASATPSGLERQIEQDQEEDIQEDEEVMVEEGDDIEIADDAVDAEHDELQLEQFEQQQHRQHQQQQYPCEAADAPVILEAPPLPSIDYAADRLPLSNRIREKMETVTSAASEMPTTTSASSHIDALGISLAPDSLMSSPRSPSPQQQQSTPAPVVTAKPHPPNAWNMSATLPKPNESVKDYSTPSMNEATASTAVTGQRGSPPQAEKASVVAAKLPVPAVAKVVAAPVIVYKPADPSCYAANSYAARLLRQNIRNPPCRIGFAVAPPPVPQYSAPRDSEHQQQHGGAYGEDRYQDRLPRNNTRQTEDDYNRQQAPLQARRFRGGKTLWVSTIPADMDDDQIKSAVATQLKVSGGEQSSLIVRVERSSTAQHGYIEFETEMCARSVYDGRVLQLGETEARVDFPRSNTGPLPPYRQSQQQDDYNSGANEYRAQGDTQESDGGYRNGPPGSASRGAYRGRGGVGGRRVDGGGRGQFDRSGNNGSVGSPGGGYQRRGQEGGGEWNTGGNENDSEGWKAIPSRRRAPRGQSQATPQFRA